MSDTGLFVHERIAACCEQLGVARAHIAARDGADWQGLFDAAPDRFASLSLICPIALDPQRAAKLADRLLVIVGDRGAAAERAEKALMTAGEATAIKLSDYDGLMWSDVAADCGAEVTSALLDFLHQTDREKPVRVATLSESEGEVAGISYRIRGSGPPLLLMPLLLSPSQWEPLIPALSQHYCTIELGGAFLGSIAILESRGRSPFMGMVRVVLDLANIKPGETVLDVGCGSGVVIREIARRTAGANRLLAVDMSPYMLRAARQLSQREAHGETIEFREGHAQALPLPDASVDVAISCTVMEEGDAEKMLGELIRVTKPAGRIGVIVRAVDMPGWVNLPVSQAIKAKVEAPGLFGAGVVPGGCADASLYRRFRAVGLAPLGLFPQLAALAPDDARLPMFRQQAVSVLNTEETEEWNRAVAQADAEGTGLIATAHHCAVGIKD